MQDFAPLSALARSVRRSERSIRMAFSCAFGIAPRTFRRRYRVIRAIELLRQSDLKNEVVARELGFLSPKNFYRALRLETGLTPRQIRRLCANDASALLTRLSVGLGAIRNVTQS